MVSLKTCVSMFLLVTCTVATAIETPKNNSSELPGHAIEKSTETKPEPPPVTPVPNNTTISPTNKPTLPTTTTITPPTTTTIAPNTTTITPPTTTTIAPNTTTITPPKTTTIGPNTTTITPPTTPATPSDNKSRTWDAPSFLGGMVLAFGIVAVGFVGYRFFYLGRGGAYHTL